MSMIKKLMASGIVLSLMLPVVSQNVLADSEKYLVLGKDLTSSEKARVLKYLDVDDVNEYNVSYVTHAEEKKYLSSYISAKTIGSRALSSVVMEKEEEGEGISVETTNITYVSEKMYQNALITAGVKDVELKVAGPFKISGTAALVAATKSYEIMTGKALNQENVDVANNELVVTSNVAKDTGNKDKAADLVASLKQQVAELGDDYSREQGEKALDELEEKMDLHLSETSKKKLLDLMDSLKDVNIDAETIKTQAKNIYNDIKGYVNQLNDSGFFSKLAEGFRGIIRSIIDFFK